MPFRKEVVPGLVDPQGWLGACWSRRREPREGRGLEGPAESVVLEALATARLWRRLPCGVSGPGSGWREDARACKRGRVCPSPGKSGSHGGGRDGREGVEGRLSFSRDSVPSPLTLGHRLPSATAALAAQALARAWLAGFRGCPTSVFPRRLESQHLSTTRVFPAHGVGQVATPFWGPLG